MSAIADALVKAAMPRSAGIGYPHIGWQPPAGYVSGGIVSGITVNHDTAMTVGAFHAGVRLIAEDIASLPFNVLVHLTGGGSRKAYDHPSYAMLHDTANPEMTAMVWRETMLGHLLSWGNLYSEKEFNGLGQVVRLWPLRPDRMRVFRNEAGARVYEYTLPNGQRVVLPERNVFHVPGFGFDGLVGYSRVAMARRAIENAIAVEEYGLHVFNNGAQPGVVIRHPQQLGDPAKKNIKASWELQHQGLSNVDRTAILDEGMEIEQVGFPPQDAQFLESRRFSVVEIARLLRLAPHKLSDLERATFSNIEESNIDHVVGTLTPIMVRLEQQVDKDILGPGAYYSKHNAAAALRGNAKDRADYYRTMREIGVLTGADIRALEDLNPLTDAEKQDILWPLTSVPASAYDANGMTYKDRVAAASQMARTGWDPGEALTALGLPPVRHTGLIPLSVYPEDQGLLPGKSSTDAEHKAADRHAELLAALGAPAAVNVTIAEGAVSVPVTVGNADAVLSGLKDDLRELRSLVTTREPEAPAAPAVVEFHHSFDAMPAPVVNVSPTVTMPETKAPSVQDIRIVGQPKRRTTRTITRDPEGRIEDVSETSH